MTNMSPSRARFTPWYAAAALGAWLLAAPALAVPNACETRCAANQSGETQACAQRCPKPGDTTREREAFQQCVEGCSARFDKAYKKCAKGCGGEEDARAAAERKQKKEEAKREHLQQGPIHGSQGIRR